MQLPARFGRYLLLEKIASGGMAEIFRATLLGVEGFEKTVVIKRILPNWSERSDFIAMLVDEAKLLVHLNHPNIVQVFELGKEAETYYIAMEYVEGIDLRHLIKKAKSSNRKIPRDLVLGILIESLKGLSYAHHRSLKDKGPLGIVHRDISPQNILISYEGQVKVGDFGIAKAFGKSHETQTGVLKGKYAYMSPEQALGQPLDARSDIFACGIMLYELLFMRRLFSAATDIETLDRVRKAEIPWPEDLPQDFSPELKRIIEKSLALRPEDRFADAEEFEHALSSCLPPGQRPSGKELASFVGQLFAPEIQDLKIRKQKFEDQTQSFRRQTAVSPLLDEETASLVETGTEVEKKQSTQTKEEVFMPPAAASRDRKLGVSLALAAILILLAYFGTKFFLRPATSAGPTQSWDRFPALSETRVLPKTADLPADSIKPKPSPTPQPIAAVTIFSEPAQARLEAKFLGRKEEGIGKISLPDLPVGTAVAVHAELKDYDSENKSFQISQDPLNVKQVLRLTKKAPAFGSINVNAVPWGRVTMAGFIGGSETPVSRVRIPEGSYRVTVSNPSLGKSLSANATIRAGKTTRCMADLEGHGTIGCH